MSEPDNHILTIDWMAKELAHIAVHSGTHFDRIIRAVGSHGEVSTVRSDYWGLTREPAFVVDVSSLLPFATDDPNDVSHRLKSLFGRALADAGEATA